ncbi:MAG: tRNA (5-methylaminomethyl-2-thiouridine)(34)-methyltransferase MnmD [Crocinitomicaceae bacterium]|nr:tRNA (5-methylaminomethyl-2-thiouridine)(34)-methyltransferase MnmD [Crocinitomicaceae bacterium]
MKYEIITTNDGSKTIYVPHLDETYHSSHGAVQEAIHVFIRHGIRAIEKCELRVFEMGFGTGLNALLTYVESEQFKRTIHYSGIEAYPVELEMAMLMDYCLLIGEECQGNFAELHQADWNRKHRLSDLFSFEKIHAKIEEFTPPHAEFDIVFFDAFGPRAQEDMWAPSILKKMYDALIPGGFLVTYCAKGQVKRDLKSLGFNIEALPGPPGKREMTRAWKYS